MKMDIFFFSFLFFPRPFKLAFKRSNSEEAWIYVPALYTYAASTVLLRPCIMCALLPIRTDEEKTKIQNKTRTPIFFPLSLSLD